MKLQWAKQGLVSVFILLLGAGLRGQETLPIVVDANQLTELQRAIIFGSGRASTEEAPAAYFELVSDTVAVANDVTLADDVPPPPIPTPDPAAVHISDGAEPNVNREWAVSDDGGTAMMSSLAPALGANCDHCGSCISGNCCVDCAPCFFVFGEFLYLRPRNAEVAYASPVNGPVTDPPALNPIQVGSIGVVDADYQPGFRFGVGLATEGTGSVLGTYTRLQTSTSDQINVAAGSFIRSLVSHPGSTSAITGFLQANARNDIDFELADAEFRHLWRSGPNHRVDYFIGGRYARLQQDFQATFVDTGVEQVITDIGFDGGGIRLGLDGERFASQGQWYVYGTGAASFVAGQFRGNYLQGQSFDPTVVATRWTSGRVVTMLDIEAGVGWKSPAGRLRLAAGYLFSGWFNAVKTGDLIHAVQNNSFLDMDSTLSFDGLVGRVELRY